MDHSGNEEKRMQEVYDAYETSGVWNSRYSKLNPEVLMGHQERERKIVKFLKKAGISPENIKSKSLLEIGAGSDGNIVTLLSYGFSPANTVYNEIIDRDLSEVKNTLPRDISYILSDARNIGGEYDASFDVILLSTVFSSILDEGIRQELAAKVCRLLRPGGCILFYDFTYDNPKNKQVKKVTFSDVQKYFGNRRYTRARVTLAPPVSRRLSALFPNGFAWYPLFNWPFLRTHQLVLIR